MSQPQASLNPRTFEVAVVETDGAGGIVVTRCTGGFKGTVAFLTDGTNGIFVADIDAQPDADYPAWGDSPVPQGTIVSPNQAPTSIATRLGDEAAAAVNLATTITRTTVCYVPAAQLSKAP